MGYAVDREEYLLGVSCLSVPLAQDQVVALSLSAPTTRFDEAFPDYLEAALQVASGAVSGRDAGRPSERA